MPAKIRFARNRTHAFVTKCNHLWQRTRIAANSGERKKIVIYQLASDTLFKELQWKAADFWSFRTASFDFFLEEDYRAIIKEKISAELEGYEKDSEKAVFFEDLLAKAKKEKKQDRKEISNLLTKLGNIYSEIGKFAAGDHLIPLIGP